jgi:hypothetical protein
MKIEFRKIPLQPSDFELYYDSVKFSGTFSKISPKLVKIEGALQGPCEVECYKCGQSFTKDLDDEVNFLVSDGVYSNKSDEEELVVIETSNHILDFDELLHSEIESFRSEYFSCDTCTDDSYIDIEY